MARVQLKSLAVIVASGLALLATPALARPKWALVIHGGAGVIERKDLTPETEAAYRAAMAKAAATGSTVLDKGGSAMDAIEAVIRDLEDDPLFNAGRGAVFTAEGRNELDAAVMDGKTLMAGSVAGVTRTRHPISLARAVMEKSRHVMMIGPGADAFAASVGLEQVDLSFFFTERPERRRRRHSSRSPTTASSAPSASWRWTAPATSRRAPRPAA